MYTHEIKLIVKQKFCASSWLITEIKKKKLAYLMKAVISVILVVIIIIIIITCFTLI